MTKGERTMQGIKNLIARRRPVSDATSAAPAEPEPQRDPWDSLQEQVAADDPRSCDIDSARAARNHVPRPERPQPSPRREWMSRPVGPTDAPDLTAVQEALTTPPASKPKIWDLPPEDTDAPPAMKASAASDSALALSAAQLVPNTTKPARPASERVKTRLLGFNSDPTGQDPLAAPAAQPTQDAPRFPIGWIVVIDGPGRGACFTLTAGLSTIGRDADQTVTLDFGDTAISRERHVAIAYDEEDNRTYVGHGGKANIVRLNDKPLLSTEELQHGDSIRIGKTVLRFVGFCDDGFSWADADAPDPDHV
ncbi:FHA domain-containing protein [Mameliella sp. DP3N28-2]|nr:FHA domain-containing protein [Mameliella sediminis]